MYLPYLKKTKLFVMNFKPVLLNGAKIRCAVYFWAKISRSRCCWWNWQTCMQIYLELWLFFQADIIFLYKSYSRMKFTFSWISWICKTFLKHVCNVTQNLYLCCVFGNSYRLFCSMKTVFMFTRSTFILVFLV